LVNAFKEIEICEEIFFKKENWLWETSPLGRYRFVKSMISGFERDQKRKKRSQLRKRYFYY